MGNTDMLFMLHNILGVCVRCLCSVYALYVQYFVTASHLILKYVDYMQLMYTYQVAMTCSMKSIHAHSHLRTQSMCLLAHAKWKRIAVYLCYSKVFAIRTEAEALIRMLWACYVYKVFGSQRPYGYPASQ